MKEVLVTPSPVINPLGTISVKPVEIARGLRTLKGKTIGLLDNRKTLSDVVLNTIKDYLAQRGVKDFVYRVKPDQTVPSPPALIEDLVKTDAVIAAVADCGSCTTGLVTDTARIAKTKIPAMVIVSTKFRGLAAGIAEGLGVPDLPAVIIPHTQGYPEHTPENVKKHTEEILDEISEVLVNPSEEIMQKHALKNLKSGRA